MFLNSGFIVRFVKIFAFLVHVQPLFIKKILGVTLGLLWFDILRIRRKVAIENVMRAYPGKNQHEVVNLARKSLIHMGYTVIEFCSIPFVNKDSLLSMFTFEGKGKLEMALKKKKGVLLLTAHIGNGDMAIAALSQSGFPINLVSKRFKAKWLDNFWFNSRKKHGTRFIPPKKSSYGILKAMKKNEVVIFVLDQYTGQPNGLVTEFFGVKTGTAFGPALLAQRSGTEVLPIFCYRRNFGQHVIKILDPIPYKTEGVKDELVRRNTELFNSFIEQMIKEKPEQWMWIHRRWKEIW